jgi:hypothetical protein
LQLILRGVDGRVSHAEARWPHDLVRHAAALVTGGGRERFLFAVDTFVDGLVGSPGPGALH